MQINVTFDNLDELKDFLTAVSVTGHTTQEIKVSDVADKLADEKLAKKVQAKEEKAEEPKKVEPEKKSEEPVGMNPPEEAAPAPKKEEPKKAAGVTASELKVLLGETSRSGHKKEIADLIHKYGKNFDDIPESEYENVKKEVEEIAK